MAYGARVVVPQSNSAMPYKERALRLPGADPQHFQEMRADAGTRLFPVLCPTREREQSQAAERQTRRDVLQPFSTDDSKET